MGYQALLFCPDEKTARTVTQVLSELEFHVEPCLEPFNAVKKLMSQHFDAVVVDCDNEQNATLLFKSARNSASNQASLAVAVVEGQVGVAKAFRIGANLVLTKPINIEQAKGTLRVARGLLRKSDPAKPATEGAVASAPPVPAQASPPKTAAKSVAPAKPPVSAAPLAAKPPAPKPAAAAASAVLKAGASPVAAAADDDVLEISAAAPATSAFKGSLPSFGSGAASAPAPAREAAESKAKPAAADDEEDILTDKPSQAPRSESSSLLEAAPTLTFGEATALGESSGASRKILLGVAAAVIVSAVLYAGWAKFQKHTPEPVSNETQTVPAPVATPSMPEPTSMTPALKKPAPVSMPSPSASATSGKTAAEKADEHSSDQVLDDDTPAPSKPAAEPLVVKGGKVPSMHSKSSASDTPAPSVIGLAAAGAGAAPPDLGSSTAGAPTPVLETLNISQGVSQGLLIKKVQPVYPRNAQSMHIEGAVELMATISQTGAITHVKVLKGDSTLAQAAVDAVKQWKYKPYLLNGQPVEIQTQVTINFKLPR